MHLCLRRSFDDVTGINFRFRPLLTWSSPHGRDASSHKIWCSPELLTIFRNSRWRPPPSWIFRLWEFGHSDVLIMAFVFCTKLGKNIHNGYWDRHTYASDVHLMTSRELTSGFDFWSRGHLRIAVMHLPVTFGTDIFIQSGVIDIFSEIQDGGGRHLGFLDYVNLAIRVCWQCGICVLYQIGLKYMQWLLRSMHLCFRCSFDDVMRIDFRFRLLVTWLSAHGRDASSCKIWCRYLYPMRSYWHFAEIKDGVCRHLGFVEGNHGTTHEGTLVVRTPC